MSKERIIAAKAEVQILLDANVIREVKCPEWLANIVLVPKKNSKMRMCIDFTDLNKTCKKDPFPLPRIDTSVDKAAFACARASAPQTPKGHVLRAGPPSTRPSSQGGNCWDRGV